MPKTTWWYHSYAIIGHFWSRLRGSLISLFPSRRTEAQTKSLQGRVITSGNGVFSDMPLSFFTNMKIITKLDDIGYKNLISINDELMTLAD